MGIALGGCRAVFLDRDGILNQAVVREGRPYPPSNPGELILVEGIGGALARLKSAGFLLIVVTNQPDVARGSQTRAMVEAINDRLSALLPIDQVWTCFHDDRDACDCRKPKPGLILGAAAKWGVNLEASFMVGDRWRDISAGAAAGCRTVFVDYRYSEVYKGPPPQISVPDVMGAAEEILRVYPGALQ